MAKIGTLLITSDMDISEAKRVFQRLEIAYDECGKDWYDIGYCIEKSRENARKIDAEYYEKACLLDNLAKFALAVFVDYCRN